MVTHTTGDYKFSDDLYKSILGAPVGIILSRKTNDEILEANDEACHILQRSQAELKERNIRQFFDLQDQSPDESYMQYAQRIHMVDAAQLINAKVRPEVSVPIAGLAKVISCSEPLVCTVFWDVKRDSSQELMDHSSTFMGTISLHGQVQFASTSARALFGVEAEGMHAKMIQQYIHPEDRSQFEHCLESIRQGDGIASGVVRIKKEDVDIYTPITLISELDSAHKPIKIFITAYDNTQVRQQRARDVAELYDSSKASLVDVASSLDAMNETCRRLLEKMNYLGSRPVSPSSRTVLEESQTLTHRLSKDILSIRDKSRQVERTILLHRVLFDLKQSVQDVLKKFSETIQQKSLSFCCTIDPRLSLYYYADESRIKEVLFYLLSNAVSYTDIGGTIDLRVNLVEEQQSMMVVTFEVKDNGLPISNEAQKHLFQSHLPLDTSSVRTSKDAGKLLNLCRAIITIMQGTFGLSSDQRSGVKFYFTLQLQKGERNEYPVGPIFSPASTGIFKSLNVKAIVVDDVPLNLRVCTQVLQNLGVLKIETAENGHQAIERYTTGDADIIFMDIQMPVMDGYDAVRSIRNIEEYTKKHVPIFFSSGTDITHEQAQAAGADGRVNKPYKVDEFIRVISQNVRRP